MMVQSDQFQHPRAGFEVAALNPCGSDFEKPHAFHRGLTDSDGLGILWPTADSGDLLVFNNLRSFDGAESPAPRLGQILDEFRRKLN